MCITISHQKNCENELRKVCDRVAAKIGEAIQPSYSHRANHLSNRMRETTAARIILSLVSSRGRMTFVVSETTSRLERIAIAFGSIHALLRISLVILAMISLILHAILTVKDMNA